MLSFWWVNCSKSDLSWWPAWRCTQFIIGWMFKKHLSSDFDQIENILITKNNLMCWARDSWFFVRESLMARVATVLRPITHYYKARSHCYNGWRSGERERVRCCNCRGVRGQIIFPRRIVNTARCLARIKSAAGHSPIMHLCILCITRMGHYSVYAYMRAAFAQSHFARTDADVRSLFSCDYWKKKWGAITFYYSCYWLWWMRARITFARTHSAGGGGWRLLLFASGSAADATDAARTVDARMQKKSGYCLFGIAERWWGWSWMTKMNNSVPHTKKRIHQNKQNRMFEPYNSNNKGIWLFFNKRTKFVKYFFNLVTAHLT